MSLFSSSIDPTQPSVLNDEIVIAESLVGGCMSTQNDRRRIIVADDHPVFREGLPGRPSVELTVLPGADRRLLTGGKSNGQPFECSILAGDDPASQIPFPTYSSPLELARLDVQMYGAREGRKAAISPVHISRYR